MFGFLVVCTLHDGFACLQPAIKSVVWLVMLIWLCRGSLLNSLKHPVLNSSKKAAVYSTPADKNVDQPCPQPW